MRSARLRILDPCHEDYDAMHGSGATRFCTSCRKHVTNLSELTEVEARAFLDAHAGEPVCVRYAVRGDGEVVHRKAARCGFRFVAALSLAMAACTGYVDADELASPDDALVCHDAFGYAIPCDEIDEGVIPDGDAVVPTGDDTHPVTADATEDPTPPEWSAGEIVPESGEGCPVPAPEPEVVEEMGELDEGTVLMGRPEFPPSRRARRAQRQQRRLERRLARRERHR
jgi:hypothetical protein